MRTQNSREIIEHLKMLATLSESFPYTAISTEKTLRNRLKR